MATIAEQLTSLANTKTAIKDAIVAKGVAVADSDPFSAYAGKIGQIQAGGGGEVVDKVKYGVTIDNLLGDVDANGVLNRPTSLFALDFSGVKEIGNNALKNAFNANTSVESADFGSVEHIKVGGLESAFTDCTALKTVNLSSLRTVENNGLSSAFTGAGLVGHLDLSSLEIGLGLGQAFQLCRGITGVNLSSMTQIKSYGLQYAFGSCEGILNIDFSALQSIEANGLSAALQRAKFITISFPSLTTVATSAFGSSSSTATFRYCTDLAEIHFRADAQAAIEATSQYSNKWGATNATIYFDL